jgi:hypothetical protein
MNRIMDQTFNQCAEVWPLHLETRRMENKWEWFVQDASNNMRLASGFALSMEKAKAQAALAAGARNPNWYSVPA